MWPESAEQAKPLRSGLTTGTCATACSLAAATQLLLNRTLDQVTVRLPRGQQVSLILCEQRREPDRVYAATIKDAGDDPDVTHGAKVFARVCLIPDPVVVFKADKGVGVVTRKGLLLAVGEPAINPVPRNMITEHLMALARQQGYQGGFCVSVGVENGERLALKTMNPRLGIEGGLSILGTTGIVRPFSCSAYIASIHQGMDVACANNQFHIAATTGSTSEAAIREHYHLDDMALIEMGDFVGAVLKHVKNVPLKTLTLCGGFGKISKLANGHLDLHSRRSSVNFQQFVAIAQSMGAQPAVLKKIAAANTSLEVLQIGREHGLDMAKPITEAACAVAKAKIPAHVTIEVATTDRQGRFLAWARG